MILSPTRELAVQISDVLIALCRCALLCMLCTDLLPRFRFLQREV